MLSTGKVYWHCVNVQSNLIYDICRRATYFTLYIQLTARVFFLLINFFAMSLHCISINNEGPYFWAAKVNFFGAKVDFSAASSLHL